MTTSWELEKPFLSQGKWIFFRTVISIVELSNKELGNYFPVVFIKAFPRNLSFIQTRVNCWATDLARLLDLRNENSASEHQFFIILNFPYRRLISCKSSNWKITERGMRLLKMMFVFLHHDGEHQLVQDKEVGCSRGFSSDLVHKSLF